MRTYDSYKDSGIEWIGEIPSHWELKRLKYVCNVRTGSRDTQDKVEDGLYPFFVRSPIVEKINSYSYDGEGVLTVGDGVGTGKVFHYFNGKFEYHQRVYLFSNFSGLLGRYFYDYMKVKFINVTEDQNSKSTVDSLRRPLIDNFTFVLPPLSEQEQIVSYLDEKTSLIDEMVEKKKRKIELLKEYRTSLINTVVTKGLNPDVPMKDSGIEWIGEIPSHWECVKLKFKSQVNSGSTPKDNPENWNEDIPWITPSDIGKIKDNVYINDTSRKISEIGLQSCGCNLNPPYSVVITNRGPIGNVIVPTMEFTTNQGCKTIIPFEQSFKFFYYYLYVSNNVLNSLGQGTTFLELSTTSLKDFRIPLPPLFEQEQIVSYLDEKTSEIDKTIELENKKIELLKEYRQSLISNVVTGKIKVVSE